MSPGAEPAGGGTDQDPPEGAPGALTARQAPSEARACTVTAALPGPPRHAGSRGSEGPRHLPKVTQLAVVRLDSGHLGPQAPRSRGVLITLRRIMLPTCAHTTA